MEKLSTRFSPSVAGARSICAHHMQIQFEGFMAIVCCCKIIAHRIFLMQIEFAANSVLQFKFIEHDARSAAKWYHHANMIRAAIKPKIIQFTFRNSSSSFLVSGLQQRWHSMLSWQLRKLIYLCSQFSNELRVSFDFKFHKTQTDNK